MDKPRRIVAVVCLCAVMAALVACAHKSSTHGQTVLGQINGAPSVAPNATIGPPSITPQPTSGTGHGNHTTTPTKTPPTTATVTVTLAPPPPPPGFAITPTGHCAWKTYNDAGNLELQIGAEFEITYNGPLNPSTTPFRLTDDKDVNNTTGSEPVGAAFTAYLGLMLANSANPYFGAAIKLTGTLTAPAGDSNAADNSASVTMRVPSYLTYTAQTSGTTSCS